MTERDTRCAERKRGSSLTRADLHDGDADDERLWDRENDDGDRGKRGENRGCCNWPVNT